MWLKWTSTGRSSHQVNIPSEPLDDLRSICRSCHTKLHEELGYPNSTKDYEIKLFWKDEE